MLNKKFIIFTICFISILAVSVVSATDNTTIDIISIEDNDNTGAIDETILIGQTNNEEIIDAGNEPFTTLQDEIDDTTCSTITLKNNYAYDDNIDNLIMEGIIISKKLTIDGDGHTINGNNLARIFNVENNEVILKNITFVNGYTQDYGGAIYGGCTIINCTFSYNQAEMGGGAIYWEYTTNCKVYNCTFDHNSADGSSGASIYSLSSDNCIFSGCSFINNLAFYGGAISLDDSDNCHIFGCSFKDNSAPQGTGGAIDWYDSANGNVSNCTFVNNFASHGGAINWGISANGNVYNCSFVINSADYGGAISWEGSTKGSIFNCSFVKNSAIEGGAIFWFKGTKKNKNSDNGCVLDCSFVKNSAQWNGSAICWDSCAHGIISGCSFVNHTATISLIYFNNKEYANNLTINNNIILSKNYSKISFYKSDDTSNVDYNWFGHNATTYTANPNLPNCNIWLFLNGTADPIPLSINGIAYITFKLYAYNSTSNKIFEYDNSILKPINLTVNSNNGAVDKNKIILGETVKYSPFINRVVPRIDSVIASIENIERTIQNTIVLTIGHDPNLIVTPDSPIEYGLNATINLKYNNTATGKVKIIITSQKYNQTFTRNLNSTILLPANITPDNYTVTVEYYCDKSVHDVNLFGNVIVNATNKLEVIPRQDIKLIPHDIYVNDTEGVMFTIIIIPEYEENMVYISFDNGENKSLEIVGLNMNITNKDLPVGLHNLTVYYKGYTKPGNYSTKASANILPIETKIITNKTIELFVGDESSIDYTLNPNDSIGNISFSSSNPDIVWVNSTSGHIMAKSYDSAEISVNFSGSENYTASNTTVTVMVNRFNTTINAIDSIDLMVNSIKFINATLNPIYAGNLSYKSNNESIVTVDENGTINAIAVGFTTITVSFAGNNKYEPAENKTININVTKIPSSVEITNINNATYPNNITIDYVITNKNIINILVYNINDLKEAIYNETIDTGFEKNYNATFIHHFPAGTYITYITNKEAEKYYKSSINTTFTIEKASPSIIIHNEKIYYTKNITINYEVNPNSIKYIIEIFDANGNKIEFENNETTDTIILETNLTGYFNISITDIASKKKSQDIVIPRQICMYLCRSMTDDTLYHIGELLGNLHHTTIMHGYDKIDDAINTNEKLRDDIEKIKKRIKQG